MAADDAALYRDGLGRGPARRSAGGPAGAAAGAAREPAAALRPQPADRSRPPTPRAASGCPAGRSEPLLAGLEEAGRLVRGEFRREGGGVRVGATARCCAGSSAGRWPGCGGRRNRSTERPWRGSWVAGRASTLRLRRRCARPLRLAVCRTWQCGTHWVRRRPRRLLKRTRREAATIPATLAGRDRPLRRPLVSPVSPIRRPASPASTASGRALGRLREAVAQLEGVPLSWQTLVGHILPARAPGFRLDMLDRLATAGELLWVGSGRLGSRDGRVAIYRRERFRHLVREVDGAAAERAGEPDEGWTGTPHGAVLEATRDARRVLHVRSGRRRGGRWRLGRDGRRGGDLGPRPGRAGSRTTPSCRSRRSEGAGDRSSGGAAAAGPGCWPAAAGPWSPIWPHPASR